MKLRTLRSTITRRSSEGTAFRQLVRTTARRMAKVDRQALVSRRFYLNVFRKNAALAEAYINSGVSGIVGIFIPAVEEVMAAHWKAHRETANHAR